MSTTTPTEPVAPIEPTTTTDDATPRAFTPPGAGVDALPRLARGADAPGLPGARPERALVAPDHRHARLPRLPALGRRVLLPLAGQRPRARRLVRRPGALVPRRHPAAQRGPSAPVPFVPRALVVDRPRRRHRAPSRVRCPRLRNDRGRRAAGPPARRQRGRLVRGWVRRAVPADVDQRRHDPLRDDGDLHDRGRAHRRRTRSGAGRRCATRACWESRARRRR